MHDLRHLSTSVLGADEVLANHAPEGAPPDSREVACFCPSSDDLDTARDRDISGAVAAALAQAELAALESKAIAIESAVGGMKAEHDATLALAVEAMEGALAAAVADMEAVLASAVAAHASVLTEERAAAAGRLKSALAEAEAKIVEAGQPQARQEEVVAEAVASAVALAVSEARAAATKENMVALSLARAEAAPWHVAPCSMYPRGVNLDLTWVRTL